MLCPVCLKACARGSGVLGPLVRLLGAGRRAQLQSQASFLVQSDAMPAGRGWRGAAAMVRAGSEALMPHCALSRWQALRSFKLSVTVDPKYHPKIIGRKGAVITQIRLEHDVNIQFPDKDDGSQVGAGGLPCCGPASALCWAALSSCSCLAPGCSLLCSGPWHCGVSSGL